MALPAATRSYHTVWIRSRDHRAVPTRYVMAGDHLVCFGDDGLRDLGDGEQVTATLHAIANGGPVASFPATLREVPASDVDLGSLGDLLANVMRHDGSVEDGTRWLEEQRRTRRVVELVG